MIPTWPMVFAALIAGVIAGFMVPDRPQSRSAPVEASAPAKQNEAKIRPAENNPDSKPTQLAGLESTKAVQTGDGPCTIEAWPYRKPGCLDRAAAVAPANTTVNVRPADPVAIWQDGEKKPDPEPVKSAENPAPSPATAAETPKQTATVAETPKEAAPAQQAPRETTAVARPPRETPAARAAPEPAASGVQRAVAREPAAVRQADENREQRRPARRAAGNLPEFNDGIPTRVYLRGPDGRLYLAPDYRPQGRTVYYVR